MRLDRMERLINELKVDVQNFVEQYQFTADKWERRLRLIDLKGGRILNDDEPKQVWESDEAKEEGVGEQQTLYEVWERGEINEVSHREDGEITEIKEMKEVRKVKQVRTVKGVKGTEQMHAQKPLELNFDEWIYYFSRSAWKNVYLLVDPELYTGTIIFAGYDLPMNGKGLVKELRGAIIKDVSWTLFQLENTKDLLNIDTLSCIIINNCNICSPAFEAALHKTDYYSRLFNETKILFIEPESFSEALVAMDPLAEQRPNSPQCFANHLFPLRKQMNSDSGEGVMLGHIREIYNGLKSFTAKPYLLQNLNSGINLIYAPNGSGKSTILDGVYTLIKGDREIKAGTASLLWNVITNDPGVFMLKIMDEGKGKVREERYGFVRPAPKDEGKAAKLLPQDLSFETFVYSQNKNTCKISEYTKLLHNSDLEKNMELLTTILIALDGGALWIKNFKLEFDRNEKQLKLKVKSYLPDQEERLYDLDLILDSDDFRLVSIGIFFFLYYVQGYKESKVIILDDIFDHLDRKQYYNLLRFIMIFRNLERMKETQWIIFTQRKSIADYFCYRYLTRNDQFYNWLDQAEGEQDRHPVQKLVPLLYESKLRKEYLNKLADKPWSKIELIHQGEGDQN